MLYEETSCNSELNFFTLKFVRSSGSSCKIFPNFMLYCIEYLRTIFRRKWNTVVYKAVTISWHALRIVHPSLSLSYLRISNTSHRSWIHSSIVDSSSELFEPIRQLDARFRVGKGTSREILAMPLGKMLREALVESLEVVSASLLILWRQVLQGR